MLIFGAAAYLERRAGKDINSYFLANQKMPWWVLGMSGSSTSFDITGTMWIVSVFYVLGMKGMWVHWFWGFPFAGFVLAYKAKWAYRSGTFTGVEWMVFRFGRGRAGAAARLISVVWFLIMLILGLGYAGTGVGKFLEEFLPFDRSTTIPILFIFTGLYVALGGFYSVIVSDFIQTVLLSFAAVYISIAAFVSIDPELFRQTVGDDWFSVAPVMALDPVPEEYPDPFGLLLMLWFVKGTMSLFSATGGSTDFQRYRAVRNEAEASKIGLAWGIVFGVRWSLVMGFTAFGLSILVNQGGAIDSERVLPMVLNQVIPIGIKGLIMAGLLAAFMSTFDSGLNVAASFIVNDLVKPVWKDASQKMLMRVSYISTLAIVAIGIVISMYTESIDDIWKPINFALGGALLIPMLITPYWWRIGGWAYCVSGACTMPVAFYINVFTDMRELYYFPILGAVSLVSCLAASYLFSPAPDETLKDYYRKVRPFGLWGPVRRMLEKDGEDPSRPEQDRLDIPVAIVATAFFVFLYQLFMDTVLHNWGRVVWLVLLTALSGTFLYFAWWKRLPHDMEAAEEFDTRL